MTTQTYDLESIHSILTLRYNNKSPSPLPHKTIEDFSPTESDIDGKKVESFLEQTIENKLENMDKIGLALSSGIDSSLLLAMIRAIHPDLEIVTITMSFFGAESENKRAVQLSDLYDTCHIHIDNFSILKNIKRLVSVTREPRWNTYNLFVAEKAKQAGCDCLVTGDGGDELFAGYVFRYKQFQEGQEYMDCHRNDWVEDQEELLNGFHWSEFYNSNPRNEFHPESLDDVMLADYNGKLLHDFLPTDNKISQDLNLDIITPYLSDKLISFAPHLPLTEKYDGKIGKLHLRKISSRFGLKQCDEKRPFSPNLEKEWKEFGDILKQWLTFSDLLIYKHEIINKKWVDKHLNATDYRHINKFLQLYALEEYLRGLQ